MASLRLGLIDKQIISLLRRGGDLNGAEGSQLVVKFTREALQDELISLAAARANLTPEEVAYLYNAMIASLLPNPCIKAGTLMLAASLPFMESTRGAALLVRVGADISTAPPEDRRDVIFNRGVAHARVIWEAHTRERGEADFKWKPGVTQKGTGCLLFIALGLAGTVAACAMR